ncbi:hypothetical protein [Paenibacillus agri]|uniref:Uncharacterized protein n=1 Tax=Paenibacillus agri TaxID=2744309 RepID=A0A850ELN5_9BACL|nr:hypothetical protein [Paenibacillus agri]NUU61326.1 hypothetical protein [Paenibacillus agri]
MLSQNCGASGEEQSGWTEEDWDCWEEHGYFLRRRAVPKFYILRLLSLMPAEADRQGALWNKDLSVIRSHPYMWDILLRYKVYEAFSGLWEQPGLWLYLEGLRIRGNDAQAASMQSPKIEGCISLLAQQVEFHYADHSGRRLTIAVEVGDLLIYASDKLVLLSQTSDLLPVTMVPAQDSEDCRSDRILFWNEIHQTGQHGRVILNELGERLLGLSAW